jgi:pSer/pThr/pTyr-binding forkhead associated (FHA) protein
MSDPRLNSIHLKAARKEDFRAARDALLNSCGDQTLALDAYKEAPPKETPTAIVAGAVKVPVELRYVLVDHDLIHPLKVGINTVGRMPDNDVVVADPYVSRRHVAILVHAQDGCELHDIASRNGTLLNGKPLAGPTPLHSGDCIQLSDHQLVFLCQDEKGNDPGADRTQHE